MSAVDHKADVERLFSVGAHFAQVKSRRHPSMQAFVLGAKGRQEIIDLAKTAEQLATAKAAMNTYAKEGKTVLYVGGKTEIASFVKKAAESIGAPHVASRWLGGTITNWPEIKKRIDRLAELTDTAAGGTLAKQRTKLELLLLSREQQRLEDRLGGIKGLAKRPDALLVVDTRHEKHAVKEARSAGIPIIAIMSSDCDVKDAAFPIVANDSSRDTVSMLLTELTEAYAAGRAA